MTAKTSLQLQQTIIFCVFNSYDWYQFIFVWKDGSNRKNVVFLHGNKIIGFESFYFQNGGKTAARFAYRLRKELRGQGLSRYKHCLSLFRLTSGLPIIVCNINLLSKKCAKTKSARNMINYTFLKSAYHCEFKFSKISRKFCKTKFVFKDNCAKIYAKFLRKNCSICFLLLKAF